MTDFPGTARDDAASFGYDCYAYVGTGMQVGWSLTNDWWRYDALGGTWDAIDPLPATPRQYCAAHTTTEGGFLFGGIDASGPLSELWFYSFATGEWSPRASLPAPGRYACSAFGAYNELFVVAGLLANASATNELWEYDIQGDQWIQRASLPGVGRHRCASASGTRVYLFGGADDQYVPINEAWEYDRDSDTWAQLASMPEARYSGAAISMGQALVYIGGVDDTGTIVPDGFQYISGTDLWVPWPHDLPGQRRSGILAKVLPCSGYPCYYYGLGYDGSDRHNDWYALCPGNGLDEFVQEPLVVTPNPASTTLFIAYPNSTLQQVIQLHDEAGRTVASIAGMPSSIDISSLAPGAYFISMHSTRAHSHTPFIKLP